MGHVCVRSWASSATVMLFHTLTFSWTGAMEPTSKQEGRQQQAAMALQEDVTHQFSCHSDGRDPRHPLVIRWHLDGNWQKQEPSKHRRLAMTSGRDSDAVRLGYGHNSTFSLRPRKWNRELVCVASNPRTGERYNATITLSLQFKPEILRVNVNHSETSDPAFALVLFALVRSNPPATISFVDQSGQLVADTTDFLLLDSQTNPQLANNTLRIMLSSLSGTLSLNVTNTAGTVQSNLTLAEFLQSRVEVPMLGIVTGGAMAFMALLILSLIVLCLMQKNKSKSFDQPVEIVMTKKSDSASMRAEGAGTSHLPRDHMSLPSHVQLNDLSTLTKAAQQNPGGGKREEEEEEEDLSLVYAARGFARYPMVGYIYKVNSTSSEEIWL
ncbi:transmembrane protein 25 [Takifugu rubripes]|uniref:Ig-like domain-containing protein n=1 Tax=Takifugu rubripes TaxID=31033 RepID=H2S9Q9_TAKRU|nr:transmembrane protein 25 [Takifugu rubripes]XP_029700285.1 transmembrane protein 25 [Takifugu rubripes]